MVHFVRSVYESVLLNHMQRVKALSLTHVLLQMAFYLNGLRSVISIIIMRSIFCTIKSKIKQIYNGMANVRLHCLLFVRDKQMIHTILINFCVHFTNYKLQRND